MLYAIIEGKWQHTMMMTISPNQKPQDFKSQKNAHYMASDHIHIAEMLWIDQLKVSIFLIEISN